MPCKIQIKQNITRRVEEKTNYALSKSLPVAQSIAKGVNAEYGVNVVNIVQRDVDYIDRIINIPQNLIDRYYQNELAIEEQEARDIQQQDAERMGETYTDDYLFQTKNIFVATNEIENKLRPVNKTINSMGSEKNIDDVLKKAGLESELRKQFIQLVNDNPSLKSLKVSEVLSTYLREFVKDSDRQYYRAIDAPLSNKLEEVLIDYFDKFKIRRQELDNLKEKFGVDSVGVFDVLAKTVYYAKNRNLLTLPEEYGHVFVELLGSISNKKADNQLFKYMFDNIDKWDGYQRVLRDYKDLYVTKEGNMDIYKIKKEAIGQAIGIALVRNFKSAEGLDSFWSKVQELIDYVLNLIKGIDYVSLNTTVDSIAKDILNKNYDKLDRMKKDTSNYNLLTYSETIKNQNKIDGGKALKFMQWFSNKGMLITGSLAYRLQGTTYRPEIDALHDIDNIVPSDVHKVSLNKEDYLTPEQLESSRLYYKYISEGNYREAKKYKLQGNIRLNIDEIVDSVEVLEEFKKKFPDADFLYSFYNEKANAFYITINAIWSENQELKDRFKSYTGSFNSRLENFTKEELEQIYLFDFFLRPESSEQYKKIEDPEYGLSLAHFNYAFYEKLNMMGRAKDAFDYQMWDYYDDESILAPDFNDRLTYFQLQKSEEKALQSTTSEVEESFNVTNDPEYTNSVKKIDQLGLTYNTNKFNKSKVLVHRLGVGSSEPSKDILNNILSILNSNQPLYLSTSAIPNPDILKDSYYSEYIPGKDSKHIEKIGNKYYKFLNDKETEISKDEYIKLSREYEPRAIDETDSYIIIKPSNTDVVWATFEDVQTKYVNTSKGTIPYPKESLVDNVTENLDYLGNESQEALGSSLMGWNEVVSKVDLNNIVKVVINGKEVNISDSKVMQQKAEMPASRASNETLERVKGLIAKMGVKIESLVKYAKAAKLNLKDVNAVADMVNGIIAVAEGKEDVALTEEMVHIATAILEAKNPKMVTEMIAKIDRFKIYNQTLKLYKDDPAYQLPNGKPDIRKIKKEAVDKLIAELIVNGGQDVAQYPELLEEENQNLVQRWWNNIMDWFRGQYKNSNVDIFQQTADIIMNDEVGGEVTDIQNKDVYYQMLSAPQEAIQKEVLDRQSKIKKVESGEKVDPMFMDTEEASNWYEIQNEEGVFKRIEKRVTDRVKAWYRQRFGNKTFTKEEQAFNEFKRKFGVKAHGWFEDIHGRYFNSDGTRKISIDKRKIKLSQTEEDMYNQLEKYFSDLVAKFSENGKTPLVFSELMLYDPKEKEAGTIDLMIVDENGKVNIFDWKFMSMGANQEDVAWYKQGAYNIQLGRYKDMLRNSYGVKEFGMNRAIPIIMDIKSPFSMNPNADPIVAGIAIGSVNPSEIKELRLIPVSEETESTGFDTLDTLINDLNAVYRQISKTNVTDDEEKEFKSKRLNSIKKAIRAAQGSLNIAPLVEVIREMRISGQMIIDDYTTTYANRPATADDLNNKELSDFSDEMREYLAFAEIFGRVDDRIRDLIYNSEMETAAENAEQKEAVKLRKDLLDSIRDETSKIREHKDAIKDVSGKFADKFIGQKNLVTGLLNPEAVLKGLGALFNGVSDLPLASLKILYKLVNNAKGMAARVANGEVEELMAIRKRLVERGGNTRDLIKQIYQRDDKDNWVNKLIYKYNKDFYTAVDQNAESGYRSRAWLENNIDVEAYKKEALQKMNENIRYYERRYADDSNLLDQMIYEETLKWDIDNENFNGWNNSVIKRHPLEKWQSQEYINLSKDKDLLDLYEFISNINQKAKSVGYIQNAVASTFLPFVRKSMAESLAWDASLSVLTSMGDSLSMRAEDVGYGSINELTKELEHGVPKYYTHDFSRAEDGTHDYTDVSEDLFKNMIMYINHMEKYSMLTEIEGQLQLVKTIEAGKDHLNTSQTGDIIIKNGKPEELAGNKENTQMFDDFLRGLFYEQKYPLSDSDTPLNLNVKNAVKKAINKVAGREVYTVDENPSATSLVKSIDAMNRAFQLKTLGFEVLSGAVNAFGANIQVATQAGNYFKAREVLANEFKLLGNKFKNDEERDMFIQLVDAFMPLKDDPTYDKLKEAGLTKLTRGSFSDFLMVFMREPEQHMEKSIFLTLLDNTMVEDGKLVNIREFVKNKYKDRRSQGAAKAREIDVKIDSEIAELKRTRSISVTKKLVDGKLEIPGFDINNVNELQRLTNLTRRIARNATGGMSDSDMNRASMNIWLKSMMVFKGWIPKLLKTRFSELAEVSDDFSTTIDEDGMTIGQKYDIGRIRLFGHVLGDGIIQGAANIHNIIVLNDAGLARLDKMYEDFAASYEKRTGKVLQMDKADFIDLMRNNLRNQVKELAMLMSLFAMYLSLGFMAPDDDEDKATKNFYRFSLRTVDKFVNELSFFYNPVEFQKLLSGSAFPALGIFSDIERFTSHFFMETTGVDLSEMDRSSEEVRKQAQPIKYFSKMLPIAKSMITYMAIIDSEFAKEYDVTIQKESMR